VNKRIIKTRSFDENNPIFGERLHPLLQRIYAARGITSLNELTRRLDDLLPYQNLLNVDKAVELIAKHRVAQNRILIVGDFDADGATSSALAVSALRTFGVKEVDYLVPNRFAYGYGLTPEIVDVAKQWQPKLIITVDNGISSVDGVAAAKAAGIDVLVTDHHLPGAKLPDADAIVNPNQPECSFAAKSLAGVGVIFYIMLALRRHLVETGVIETAPNMGQFLDLVALGTVADVVPLEHTNRILVYQGCQRIRAGKMRPGIKALLQVGKRDAANLQTSDLGFAVAPRLNAAGRLDDMSLGIECLLETDEEKALEKAQWLDQLNIERREIESGMQTQAQASIDKINLSKSLPVGLCLYDPSWHQGVIGIVAGRIKEKIHRPVIAFAKASETEIKGSARSIPGVHIRDILDLVATQNPGLITKFGGHAMAAGLSLPADKIEAFAGAFATVCEQEIDGSLLQGEVLTDGELDEANFSLSTHDLLSQAGPWGQAFPEPLFHGEFEVLRQYLVGEKHLKCTLRMPGGQRVMDAIIFNVDTRAWPNPQCDIIRLAYRLDCNRYKGSERLQLIGEYLEPAES
jgi:single-stranded-DNA-specific exonuclease